MDVKGFHGAINTNKESLFLKVVYIIFISVLALVVSLFLVQLNANEKVLFLGNNNNPGLCLSCDTSCCCSVR